MWQYTPRQVQGFLFLAARRVSRKASLDLTIAASARGKAKDVKAMVKKLQKAEPTPP